MLNLPRQAFVEFASPQAATAVKRLLESDEAAHNGRKFAVTYTSASVNPYRTLPKDAPVRGKDGNGMGSRDSRSPGGHASPGYIPNPPNQGGGGNMPMNNNFRGGRGGGFNNNRGPRMNNNMGGGFPNRNFSGPPMGGAPTGGFQSPPMVGFMMGGMNPFVGGFANRGNMMGGMRGGPVGGRGGRGGMGPNGMMAGMGNMGGGMMGGMGGPMGGMGMNPMGVQGTQPFYHQQQQRPPQAMSGMGNPNMSRFPSGYPGPSTTGSYPGQYPLTPASSTSPHSLHYSSPPRMNGSLNRNSGSHHLGQGGFQGPQTHFNPAFFGQNQAAGGVGDGSWNPHGTKRQRPE